LLTNRGKYREKLIGISKHANEILLWRQLKIVNAKSVWIAKNRNGYSRAHAVVYFKNAEDRDKAMKTKIKYFEYNLEWENRYQEREERSSRENSFSRDSNWKRERQYRNRIENYEIVGRKLQNEEKKKQEQQRRQERKYSKRGDSVEEELDQIKRKLRELEYIKEERPHRYKVPDRYFS
jgi:hypothetical protein